MTKWSLLLSAAACLHADPDLTGLWHTAFKEPGGAKRELHLALDVRGERITGEVETPTRHAPLVEGRLKADGFTAVAQSIWDGKLARRPIEGQLRDGTLFVKVQAWPEGPMASYELKRISGKPLIPKLTPAAPPPIRDILYNGLAKTPPMGWNSWNRFGCRVNDRLIREMADAMVSSGMKDAGYTYINIDDCWQSARDAGGVLQPDASRFPDMKSLTEYVHSKGLKIGIYSSPGPRTCAGYEGSYGHEEQDATTWAAWGFDYVKYDWCSAGKLYPYEQMRPVLQKMGAALQATGRPMVYSISQYGVAGVWEWAPKVGANLWRTTTDIGDNWTAIESIGFDQQLALAKYAGPGGWNDPDMLEVGNGGMTTEEYRTHMTLWAMLAAPLLAGNDLRSMSEETRRMLTNREVIAIDQDPLGKQANRVWKSGTAEIWTRPLNDGSTAVAMFNRSGEPAAVRVDWKAIGLPHEPASVRDLWRGTVVQPGGGLAPVIPGHGTVLLRVR